MLKGTRHLIIPNAKDNSSHNDITNCHNMHGSAPSTTSGDCSNKPSESQGTNKPFVNNSTSNTIKSHQRYGYYKGGGTSGSSHHH